MKRLNLILRSLVAAFVFACFTSASSASDVQTIARAIDNHYNHLHTLVADFTEIYSGAGAERTESGTLWLKKPGKMRWEYRSPREKLFVSDGKQAWFFIPGERQARRIPMNQLEDLRSPLALLLGKTRLMKELKDLTTATDVQPLAVDDVVLEGRPGSLADRITQVVLEITHEDRISRIVLDGTDGSVTEYRFSKQKEDVAIPDQQFHFVPPPGVEVTEGDFAQ